MYLAFALLAPIGMFGLMWGLTWFEDRMLGPAVAGREVPSPPRAKPSPVPELAAVESPGSRGPVADIAEATPVHSRAAHSPETPMAAARPLPTPIPLQPVTTAHASALPPKRPSARVPIRHHVRHSLKRGRGLRAA